MKETVAILGCGPAGLLAAHAAVRAGYDINIISRKQESKMFGSMYLHEHIPEITDPNPAFGVSIRKEGTREQYALKVYGDPKASVSWDKFKSGEVPAWDLKLAYRVLWELYESFITDVSLDADAVWAITTNYKHVFSSVPLLTICYAPEQHQFAKQKIWVHHGEQPQDTLWQENLMFYNALPVVEWYRYSLIQGYMSWEYAHEPLHVEEHGFKLTSGFKPRYTTCPCHPDMIRVGRFGRWDKQALSHHAYFDTLRVLGASYALQ